MTQYGFFIDLSRCIGCHACLIACKQWHNIEPGPTKWLRVYQWENGAFPDIEVHTLPVMCFHCEKPVCAEACPNQAITKENKYGAVLVDRSKCTGSRKCYLACPYGSPQFNDDEKTTRMSKCTMCIDRLEQGLKPICVLSCSMRALEFGPLDEIKKKYGSLQGNSPTVIPEALSSQRTLPAVVFKPEDPKKQIVPYDYRKALALWQKRHPDNGEELPDIFEEMKDVTGIPENTYLRNRLVLKPKNTEELMTYTTDDE